MNAVAPAEDYQMYLEKRLAVVLAIGTGLLWWNGIWGSRGNFIADFMGCFKLAIFVMALVLGIRIFLKGAVIPAAVAVGIALAYNLFVPLRLDSDNWIGLHFAASGAALWIGWRLWQISRVMTPERVSKMLLAEERVRVVEEAIADGRLDRAQYEETIRKLTGR